MSIAHPVIPMTQSGFCLFPSTTDPASSHAHCRKPSCTCTCHGGTATATAFKAGQVVADASGEHHLYVSATSNGKHLIESLETGERKFAPVVHSASSAA